MPHPLDEQVRQIVRHAYEHTEAMRERMDAAGITPDQISGVESLSALPAISKDVMVKRQAASPPFGGMLAVPMADLKWVFLSPGPLYEGVSDEEEAVSGALYLLKEAGFGPGDVVLNTMSYHLVPFGVQFDIGVRRAGATVLPAGVGNTDLQVKLMADLGATAYIGTPSFLMTLIKRAEEFGVDFKAHSRLKKAIVTAEPLPPSLRQALNDYGVQLTNLYGTAELGALGYERDGETGFQIVRDKLVQICDPESGQPLPDGEIGEVVATNFNFAYPIIRIGTGDLSRIENGRLMGWLGRSGDAVKVRGMFLHPNQLGMLLRRFPEITGYQAVIDRIEERDTFTLRLVLQSGADGQALQGALNEAIPSSLRVRADQIEIVPALPDDAPPIRDQRSWD